MLILDPLTPSHFLIGRVAGFQPQLSDTAKFVNVSDKDLNKREPIRKRQLEKFWKMLSDDYLRN